VLAVAGACEGNTSQDAFKLHFLIASINSFTMHTNWPSGACRIFVSIIIASASIPQSR